MSTAADYGELNPPEVLTFTESQLTDCATIPIVDDNIVENPEFFIVILESTEPQVVITTDTANVFINDDDGKACSSIAMHNILL